MSKFDRRGFLRTATVGAALAPIAGSLLSPSPTGAATPRPGGPGGTKTAATFRWLGTSGWRVDAGSSTLLVDPYVTRFDTGMADGAFNPDTRLEVDAEAVGRHTGTPKVVLVTHAHWDHFNDVPHIATSTGARVVGTATTCNLALALDVKDSLLSPVKGGEVLDFGDYVVEVVASLHSRNANYSMLFPGVRLTRPKHRPKKISELPEGDTLAFQVTVKGGPSVFFMGGSDFVERNLTGLAPDVAMIPTTSSSSTYDYVSRLLRALDMPRVVVPVHWDSFEGALQNPPQADEKSRKSLAELVAAVRRVSPETKVVIPDYLTPHTFG
ncbi:MBL fold metallo-hydrolase [Streptosporangium sp. NBC_01469]|uniref:MBL fold metallo-hydrolase n=1 Tax=Streptosporangium sp. NBC_01469 TaxID=2903898 RepID=UPI002E27D875|nr:MBL fold metallo-hydrolase [Streptosporangium sp. NBC_01469]